MLLCYNFVMNPKKVCIFIDGENLRHSISHLFTEFDKRTYLPRADWGDFFDWVVEKVLPGSERVRTYWYVVKNVDFSPTNPSKFLNAQKDSFVRAASNDLSFKSKFENANPANQEQLLNEKAVELERRIDEMTRRSKGWDELHEKIEGTFKSVEFRKVGTIRYDLFSKKLGDEKAVDVHLAVDMVTLKDIYDVVSVPTIVGFLGCMGTSMLDAGAQERTSFTILTYMVAAGAAVTINTAHALKKRGISLDY